MNPFFRFCLSNKDATTIALAAFAGTITLFTFIKALIEYRLQGRQKRAELFDKLKNLSRTDEKISRIISLIEDDNEEELQTIPTINKYYYLGFYEQIAIAVNSDLIRKDVAHYMFGYYAIRCWESNSFWKGIDRDDYYWSTFKKFAEMMRALERRNVNKQPLVKVWDFLTRRNNFKY